MMNSHFFDSGIQAVHKVIIGTRLLSYQNADPQLTARVLDHADALGFMLMQALAEQNFDAVWVDMQCT